MTQTLEPTNNRPHRLLGAAQSVMRVWPNCIAGKTRIGRWLLSWLAPSGGGEISGVNGLSYQVPSYHEPIALGLFKDGVYEAETIAEIVSHLPLDGIFVDIGANIGAVSIPVAASRPDATVVAIEADPQICQMLRANVERNRMPKLMVCEALVGERAGSDVSFFRAPGDKFGMGSIAPQFSNDALNLPQKTLSDLLKDLRISRIDVIKVDVEGAEHKVLQGAHDILVSPNPPLIIFEFMDWAEERIPGQTAGDAQRLLMKLGYHINVLGGDAKPLSRPIVTGGAMLVARHASKQSKIIV